MSRALTRPSATLSQRERVEDEAPVLHFARNLRAEQTDAEARLWYQLRGRRLLGCKFRRQHTIPPYIVDFYCHEARLIIEADGSQHADCAADQERDEFMARLGLKVLRFWNHEILQQLPDVLAEIARHLPSPSGRGAGGEG